MIAAQSLERLIASAGKAILPPVKKSCIEAAEKHRYVNNQVRVGKYRSDETPYVVDPCNCMTSGEFDSVVFVGPAQTGKTEMVFNLLTHTAIYAPRDMMIIEASQSRSRDFSIRRLKKFLRETEDVDKIVLPGKQNRSIYNILFESGMILTMSWPTVNELSGRPIGVIWLGDYDRMPIDIGGDGDAFKLAFKRATTFRNKMVVAESSPSRIIENKKWTPDTPHKAPPTTGILALYNEGDRRRWYWQCDGCWQWFEPDFKLLKPGSDEGTPAARAKGTHLVCPHPGCGRTFFHDGDKGTGFYSKAFMNQRGRWVRDGQWLDEDGNLHGEVISPSRTASFWLKGVAAQFTTWEYLMSTYLQAMEVFETTGDDSTLKTTINTDQGLPYFPPSIGNTLVQEAMMARAEALGERVVPRGCLYLIATVDTQGNRWEVQVHGFGMNGETWIIDRFAIKKSMRFDPDGERYLVSPAKYAEDWNLVTEEVLKRSYPLDDDSGRRMSIKMTGVDAYGVPGVTENAYSWYRNLRRTGNGLQKRVLLIRGEKNNEAPIVEVKLPDAIRKDRHAAAAGEIPVAFICNTKIKDLGCQLLQRETPGAGYVHFPDWLPESWFAELVAEERGKDRWEKIANRNESWDLYVYAIALNMCRYVQGNRINWTDPPAWAKDWDRNELVFNTEQIKTVFEKQEKRDYDLASLADDLL